MDFITAWYLTKTNIESATLTKCFKLHALFILLTKTENKQRIGFEVKVKVTNPSSTHLHLIVFEQCQTLLPSARFLHQDGRLLSNL